MRPPLLLLVGLVAALTSAQAERVSDVRSTKHNLSAAGPGTVKATTESQVCVFCHTPHGATQQDKAGAALAAPLWNRSIPAGSTYTPYTSASLDAAVIQGQLDQPGGSSKLCLSCHDGTVALGNVNVLNGVPNPTVAMSGTGPGGVMGPGAGETTGFTRNLGVDLRNDHPISVTYNSALANRDAELRDLDVNQRFPAGTGSVIGVREIGFKPLLPLEPTGVAAAGQVQCGTCHDPHLHETDATRGPPKFLRGQRFQEGAPAPSGFNAASDIVCLSCHDKNRDQGIWANSAHANPLVGLPTYKGADAALREFPDAIPVWRASCLNCHDTHTVPGARRLAREGTDSLTRPRQGGNPAQEETCYQCHSSTAETILNGAASVPDIRTDFNLAIRMPITTAEQGAAVEPHDIGGDFSDPGFIDCTGPANRCGADFVERRANLRERHAECTDCHNPHRAIKNRLFYANGAVPDAAGTHLHTDSTGFTHTNIASGALRGTFGVEPIYGSASFQDLPGGYEVKRGDPGLSVDFSTAAPHVTREYQICLKCHSNYGYLDNNLYPLGNRPDLGRAGGTASGTNGLTQYTNQAKEFQAPTSHRGQVSTADSGAGSAYSTNNHRSWHPVMRETGRTLSQRGGMSNSWRLPWSNGVGTQTMYCSDCHGSRVTSNTSVVPDGGEQGKPWGPHGSSENFLLKGPWSATLNSNSANLLCFKCHNPAAYSQRTDTRNTGFYNTDRGNLHGYHVDRIGSIRCNWCHVAVPHGWKNKGLLVNLNDVGPEAGQAPGSQWRMNASGQAYTQQPYYLNAKLKVRNFAPSGSWTEANCGSSGSSGTLFGTNANNATSGKDWMKDVCSTPP